MKRMMVKRNTLEVGKSEWTDLEDDRICMQNERKGVKTTHDSVPALGIKKLTKGG